MNLPILGKQQTSPKGITVTWVCALVQRLSLPVGQPMGLLYWGSHGLDCRLCARHWAKYFTFIISLPPNNHPSRLYAHFSDHETKDLKMNILTRFAHLVNERVRIWTNVWFQSWHSFPYIVIKKQNKTKSPNTFPSDFLRNKPPPSSSILWNIFLRTSVKWEGNVV